MERVPIFDAQHLTSIAKILADTDDGLTGSQIGYLLRDCEIPDVASDQTKWKRLFNAFVEFQNRRQFGNHVVVFVNKAMNHYRSVPELFRMRFPNSQSPLPFDFYKRPAKSIEFRWQVFEERNLFKVGAWACLELEFAIFQNP